MKVVVRIRLVRRGSHATGKVSFCKSLKIRMLVSDLHGAKTNGSDENEKIGCDSVWQARL